MTFEWPNKARLAMSFVINIEEGSEMSILRGDKGPEPVDELGVALKIPIRNYANESNYNTGYEQAQSVSLELLKKRKSKPPSLPPPSHWKPRQKS